jgi:leader peptidase (prepilin peptidase)/N-methyltransferase
VSWEIIALFALAGLGIGVAGRWAARAAGAPLPKWSCEAVSVVLWSAVGWWWLAGSSPGWWLPVPLAVTAFAVPLLLADLRYLRLPNAMTLAAYPVFATAIGVAAAQGGSVLAYRAGLGALVFGGLHLGMHWFRPDSLGAGDVKLAGSLGAVLGAVGWAALVLCAFSAAVSTVVLWILARRWRAGVPYGPGLLTATWLFALSPVKSPGWP